MSLTLTSNNGGDFAPHPEGVHSAVCVDVMDLGLVETEFQGVKKMVQKLRIVFESEEKTADGKLCTVSRRFTASLHPKAKLAEFLGKWRGKPVTPGESIDLTKLVGASATIVVSHSEIDGRKYASIDAVSKPTKKLKPSGDYDGAAARQRYEDWRSKNGLPAMDKPTAQPAPSKSPAAAKPQPEDAYDPEVGF